MSICLKVGPATISATSQVPSQEGMIVLRVSNRGKHPIKVLFLKAGTLNVVHTCTLAPNKRSLVEMKVGHYYDVRAISIEPDKAHDERVAGGDDLPPPTLPAWELKSFGL